MTDLDPRRAGRVTGSRIGAVLGVSPYQTRSGLLRSMVRQHYQDPEEFTGNAMTEYGLAHEDDAIAAYEQLTGQMVHSCQQFFQHPLHEWLAVTVDGLVGDDGCLDVKAPPTGSKYTHISQKPSYETQLRLTMECTGRQWAELAVWREGQPLAVSRITHDPAWLPLVLPELEAFRTEFLATIADPDLSAPHRADILRDDPEWTLAAAAYLAAVDDATAAATVVADARARLVELSGGAPARGGGVSVTHTERKGTVDFPRVLADAGVTVDLDAYRKPSTLVSTVRVT